MTDRVKVTRANLRELLDSPYQDDAVLYVDVENGGVLAVWVEAHVPHHYVVGTARDLRNAYGGGHEAYGDGTEPNDDELDEALPEWQEAANRIAEEAVDGTV